MKFFFALVFSLLVASRLCATTQMPESLVYNNTGYYLFNTPLKPYFKEHPGKRPRGMPSTDLYRNYITHFEIKDKQLYITKILARKSWSGDNPWTNVIHSVFSGEAPVKADWMNAVLVMTSDRDVYSYCVGDTMIKKGDCIVLEITDGKLTQERQLNQETYQAFYKAQFEAFQKTDDYQAAVKAKKDEDRKRGATDDDIEKRDYGLRIYHELFDHMTKILDTE